MAKETVTTTATDDKFDNVVDLYRARCILCYLATTASGIHHFDGCLSEHSAFGLEAILLHVAMDLLNDGDGVKL